MIAKHSVSVLAISASCRGLTVPAHLCTIERRNVGGVQCCGLETRHEADRRVIASWYGAGVRLRPAMDPPLITASIKRCRKLDALLQLVPAEIEVAVLLPQRFVGLLRGGAPPPIFGASCGRTGRCSRNGNYNVFSMISASWGPPWEDPWPLGAVLGWFRGLLEA